MIACAMHNVATGDKLWLLFILFVIFVGALGIGARLGEFGANIERDRAESERRR